MHFIGMQAVELVDVCMCYDYLETFISGLGVEESTLDDIDLEVDEEIDAAVRFADESEPAREDVMLSTVLAPEGDA